MTDGCPSLLLKPFAVSFEDPFVPQRAHGSRNHLDLKRHLLEIKVRPKTLKGRKLFKKNKGTNGPVRSQMRLQLVTDRLAEQE